MGNFLNIYITHLSRNLIVLSMIFIFIGLAMLQDNNFEASTKNLYTGAFLAFVAAGFGLFAKEDD